ncbi:hypothetical protein [Cryobacterium sp. 10C3]|uniref:hypothetical protein n=1 Tax=unclassified Cryobacterium TaxID=2649013 RepID=UPI003A0FCFA9
MPNEEAKLRDPVGRQKRHGQILFTMDRPATIGALPIGVAQADKVLVGSGGLHHMPDRGPPHC